MKYIEISIKTSISGIEPVVAELYSIGITDIVIDDPRDTIELISNKGTYQWDYLDEEVIAQKNSNPKITIYFEDNDENRHKAFEIENAIIGLQKKVLEGAYGENANFGELKVTGKFEDDSEWKDKWKEFFKPSKISDHIVVKPTWEEYGKEDGEMVLEIDPGMAFGTGTHETTSMCVEMLEKYIKKGDNVLDVGCGSGILSIAAAFLGAGDVLGVDIDPIAVEVSSENIKLNKVEDISNAQFGDLTKGIDYEADIVVANLMADLVIMLSSDVAKHMKKNGCFISSGILTEKEFVVSEAIRKANFKIVEIVKKGEWCCIVARF